MKSIKCTISRIYFFKKVLRFYQSLIKKFQGFQVISRASKIFQGFPGSPGPVRTLQHFFWFHANGRNMLGPTVLRLFGWAFRFCSYISILSWIRCNWYLNCVFQDFMYKQLNKFARSQLVQSCQNFCHTCSAIHIYRAQSIKNVGYEKPLTTFGSLYNIQHSLCNSTCIAWDVYIVGKNSFELPVHPSSN